MISRLIFLLSIIIQAPISLADTTQWSEGSNVCRGSWSYKEYRACEHTSHGPDKNRPIAGTPVQCGYEPKANSCFHGSVFSRHVLTPVKELIRADTWWTDQEAQMHCDVDAKTVGLSEHETLIKSEIASAERRKVCRQNHKWKRGCAKHNQQLFLSCRYTIHKKINVPNGQVCGWSDDLKRPKSCFIGHQNSVKRSPACGPAQELVTPKGYNASELMKADYRFGFECNTGDHLPDQTAEQVKTKYESLVRSLDKLQNQPESKILINSLQSLAEKKNSFLGPDQLENIRRITDTRSEASEISIGTIFDSTKDCAKNQQGQAWFCKNKQVTLSLGIQDHLNKIASSTSFQYNFAYSFQCGGSPSNIQAKLRFGKSELVLAPTSNALQQTLSFHTNLQQGLPELTVELAPEARFADKCELNIVHSEILLDETLLKGSLNSLKMQIATLKLAKDTAETSSTLPAKYSAVNMLKLQVADKVTEDTFRCHEIAKMPEEDPNVLCPLDQNYKAKCLAPLAGASGELHTLLGKLRDNSCLLVDLEEGLPKTSACVSNPSEECSAQFDDLNEILAQALQKARSRLQLIVDSLREELKRIETSNKSLHLRLEALAKEFGSDTPIQTIAPVAISKPLENMVLYDGESAPFSVGQGWDITQSSAEEVELEPASGSKHLRFKLQSANWWGAAAYIFKKYENLDLSGYKTLRFKGKANRASKMKIYLIYLAENAESESIDVELKMQYESIDINLSELTRQGFDLSKVQGFVIANNFEETGNLTVDLDDIELLP